MKQVNPEEWTCNIATVIDNVCFIRYLHILKKSLVWDQQMQAFADIKIMIMYHEILILTEKEKETK